MVDSVGIQTQALHEPTHRRMQLAAGQIIFGCVSVWVLILATQALTLLSSCKTIKHNRITLPPEAAAQGTAHKPQQKKIDIPKIRLVHISRVHDNL